MRTIKRNIVSAAIISSDGKILLGRKNANGGGVYRDCWHIPGGGIEDGEDQLSALCRELVEEVGFDVKRSRVSLLDEQGKAVTEKQLPSGERVICDMCFIVYKVECEEKSDRVAVQPGDDLVELRWFTAEELEQIKHVPATVDLLKRTGFVRSDVILFS